MKILLWLSLLSFGAHAGSETGNGGKGIVCPAGHIELLDFYESRVVRGWEPKPVSGETPFEIVANLLKRIKGVNPVRYERLMSFLDAFERDAKFLYGQELVDIPDSDHPSYPAGCEVKQLAIQYHSSDKPRYVVNGDLWNRLDDFNRAGLILHEIVYREQILAGIGESANARFFTAAVAADRMRGMSQEAYVNFVREFLPDVEFDGFVLAVCQPARIGGATRACGKRIPPRISRSKEGGLEVVGFVVPPWAPWMLGREQFFAFKDKQSGRNLSVSVFGPYRRTAFSRLIPNARYQEIVYGGHRLSLAGNDNSRFSDCFELWQCAEKSSAKDTWRYIDIRGDGISFPALTTDLRDKRLLDHCRGMIKLDPDGEILMCEDASGQYESERLKLRFQSSTVRFSAGRRLLLATNLSKSFAEIQGKTAQVSSISLTENEVIESVAFAGPFTFLVKGMETTVHRGVEMTWKNGLPRTIYGTWHEDQKPIQVIMPDNHPAQISYWSDRKISGVDSLPGEELFVQLVKDRFFDSVAGGMVFEAGSNLLLDIDAKVIACWMDGRNCLRSGPATR